MIPKISYNQATFLLSAAALRQLPPDTGIEVAFAGRSNAGKSSALNAITRIKGLAKTSKTPGRTQLINFFRLDNERRLVDLPGYGYAKVSHEIKVRWQQTLAQYLQKRTCLRGLILLMDVRHPLKELDEHLLKWATVAELPVHILLTKADKLTRQHGVNALQQVKRQLMPYGDGVTVQLFSIQQTDKIAEASQQLDQWFSGE